MKYVQVPGRHEIGAISFRTLLVLGILAITIYSAAQMIKIYDAYWTFADQVKTLIRFAFVNMNGDRTTQIINKITAMLDEMGAQYDRKNIRVSVDERQQQIAVNVWYTQIVHLPLFPNPKQFHLNVQSSDTLG